MTAPDDRAATRPGSEPDPVDDPDPTLIPRPPSAGRRVAEAMAEEVGMAVDPSIQTSTAADDGAREPDIGEPPGLPPERWLDLEGRGRTFARVGEPGGGRPDVVLVHGWTVTADATFAPSYPALSSRYRVIAPDLRGHGRGLPARRGLTLETLADDLAATLDELAVRRAIVVGYSMGGAVAQLLWRRHPERVAGLVLCSTAQHFQGGPLSDLWYRGQGWVAPLIRAYPGPARARMIQAVDGKVADGPYAAWFRRELLRSDPSALLRVGAALGRFRSSSWIGEVDVPAAVVVTTRDHTVPTRRQRSLAAAVPGAAVYEVDGPHNSAVTRSDAWVPALRCALDEVVDRIDG